nr:PREDICTED: uncharacterized protein LOC109037598 isoform X1 [Bemisia tabaci]
MTLNPETETCTGHRKTSATDSLPARCLTKLMSLRRKDSPVVPDRNAQRPKMSIMPKSFHLSVPHNVPRKWPSEDGLQVLTKRVPSSLRYVPVPPNEFYISISYENIYNLPVRHGRSHPFVQNSGGKMEGHPLGSTKLLRGSPMGSCPDITKHAHAHSHGQAQSKRGDRRYPYDYVYGGTLREYVAPQNVYETVGSNYCERSRLKYSFYSNGYGNDQATAFSSKLCTATTPSTRMSTDTKKLNVAPSPVRSGKKPPTVRSSGCSSKSKDSPEKTSSNKVRSRENGRIRETAIASNGVSQRRSSKLGHDEKCDSGSKVDLHRGESLLALRIRMTSMHGLPPLPRSLSHEAARVNGMDQSGADWSSGGGPSARPERKGRTLPTPPATLSQNGETPRPPRHVTATSEETKSIETNLATLRDEMYRLRQVDVALLAQMWSLNKAIQEFCRLQESPIPSPSDDGEDTGEVFTPKKKLPISRRRYQQEDHKLSEGSSSSSTSVELGKV